ncbi:cytokine receptor common subunit beta [Tachyglossus aculeatus]|uniref:cytokine receptor common subunit beta n=1 Tax=Tachyglossus aculeatus TaxID=9261 RepID=UPI0018F760B1|nr:cytokine receptor common subunit beta [Tachyglossus aculeatus]
MAQTYAFFSFPSLEEKAQRSGPECRRGGAPSGPGSLERSQVASRFPFSAVQLSNQDTAGWSEEMAPLSKALSLTLLALCWAVAVEGDQESFLLQNLHCHNDFTTQIVCHWAEKTDSHRYIPMNLYHSYTGHMPQRIPCEPDPDPIIPDCANSSCLPWKCVLNFSTFTSSSVDIYSFQTSRELKAELSVDLFQSVQPPAPKQLNVTSIGEKGFLLSWNVSSEVPMRDLEFEVLYKRQKDSWEDASSRYILNRTHMILNDTLIPGSTYVARIRTRIAPSSTLSGRPSAWSPEKTWQSQAGDEAQPRNLQCHFDGTNLLSCSWEVTAAVNDSVPFSLFYKPGPGAEEKECIPESQPLQEKANSSVVLQHCQVLVTEPHRHSNYLVTVRPKEEKKEILSYTNIQPPAPFNVRMTPKNNEYLLQWDSLKISFDIRQAFQVELRRNNEPWEAAHEEVISGLFQFSIPLYKLKPSSTYSARVRAKVHSEYGYRGNWSPWSSEVHWETKSELPPWFLYLLLVFFIVMLFFGVWCCHTYGTRLRKKWEEKIPNPSKSHLFQTYKESGGWGALMANNLAAFSKESPLGKRESNGSISELEGGTPGGSEEKSEVSSLTAVVPEDQNQPFPSQDLSETTALPICRAPPQASTEPTGPSKAPSVSFDFNGPYLHEPHTGSLPSVLQGPEPRPGQRSTKLAPGSLDYLCLPQGGQPQPGIGTMAGGAGFPEERAASPSPVPMLLLQQAPVPAQAGPLRPLTAGPGEPLGREEIGVPPPAVPGGSCSWAEGTKYVTAKDLILTPVAKFGGLQPATLVVPLAGSLGSPGRRPAAEPAIPPVSQPLALEDYVEHPPGLSQGPLMLSDCSPAGSLGDPQHNVMFNPDGLGLVLLQQVGDYCFFPGPGSTQEPLLDKAGGRQAPDTTLEPEGGADKRLPAQTPTQPPAIQLFKAFKQDDYLMLPPWAINRASEAC